MNKVIDFLTKNKKITFVLVAAIVVGFIIFTAPAKQTKEAANKTEGKGVVSKEESQTAKMNAMEKELQEFREFKKKLEDSKQGTAEAQKLSDTVKALGPIAPVGKPAAAASALFSNGNKKEQSFQEVPNFQTQAPAQVKIVQPPPPPPPPRLQKKQLSAVTADPADKTAPKAAFTKVYTLPASSFVEVKFISAGYATQNEPMPATVLAERAFVGPNRSSIPLKGCQIIAKMKGDIGYELAQGQAVRLTCVWPDGSVLDEKINGYLTAGDGVFGVPGEVIRQSGKFLSTVGITSFLEGFTQGLSRAQESTQLGASPYGTSTATNISGDATKYGLYKGAQDFSGAAKAFFAKQAESLVPAVKINPGTKAYVFMLDSVKLKGANFEKTNMYFDSVNLSSAQ